jgi:dTDP-4-dehydrorhamnose 3,5-epimerase
VPKLFEDDRGWFFRNFAADDFAAMGLNSSWPQMNHSFTKTAGTIRGMHYQHPPHNEVKLVRCIAGAVLDVVVDIRPQSATYLQHFATELNAQNKQMLYIPQGFAHGFQSLVANSELLYLHSTNYQPGAEGGLRYNDPTININWPLPLTIISERDKNHPLLVSSESGEK